MQHSQNSQPVLEDSIDHDKRRAGNDKFARLLHSSRPAEMRVIGEPFYGVSDRSSNTSACRRIFLRDVTPNRFEIVKRDAAPMISMPG